ncbi:hypothetical protein [Mycobacterium sp. 155]|uniref:hypothetical protein n=1 Tax=Mycobacterium sp. 155 TaxID=1157943 RepID=UPI000371EB32|nr:hypothetical protein [Mycobacterium sp. 155]
MSENTSSKKKWEEPDDHGRLLDPRQFPELNAMFYNADPSEFIKMRFRVLSLMAVPDPFLAPAFAVDRQIASIRFGGGEVPPADVRMRYLRTETVAIVHHASEALLRLYFAHIDHPECPWLGMSTSTDFVKFKVRVYDALKEGFDHATIAELFLGGARSEDSKIDVPQEEFDGTLEALAFLLQDCACRFLGDAFLYNAVKHGLTAIDLDDDSAKMVLTGHDGESVPMHTGPAHVYLHQKLHPTAKTSEGQWFVSIDDPNPERDLTVTYLITLAIDSLWNVARRRHIGRPGTVWCIAMGSVEMAVYGPVQRAANLMRRMSSELIKTKPDGDVDGTNHHISIYNIPDDWNPADEEHQPAMREVELPLRPQDIHTPTTGSTSYLPFVPKGFQQGHD